MVRGDVQRTRLSMEPALSLVPEAREPPKGCWPTTAPVGLSLVEEVPPGRGSPRLVWPRGRLGVGGRGAGAAEGLRAHHGARRLVVDVEVARGVAQLAHRRGDGL